MFFSLDGVTSSPFAGEHTLSTLSLDDPDSRHPGRVRGPVGSAGSRLVWPGVAFRGPVPDAPAPLPRSRPAPVAARTWEARRPSAWEARDASGVGARDAARPSERRPSSEKRLELIETSWKPGVLSWKTSNAGLVGPGFTWCLDWRQRVSEGYSELIIYFPQGVGCCERTSTTSLSYQRGWNDRGPP